MLDKFVSIIWAIIKNPYEYFSRQMPKDNLVREPIIFTAIITTITTSIYYLGTILNTQYGTARGIPALLFLLVLMPISTIIILYINAFFMQCIIFFFCPQRANFNQTLKVLAYSSAADVFMVFPVIGVLIAAIFQIRSVIFGLSAVHNFSALKMFILLIAIPFVLVMLIFIFITAIFGAAFTSLLSGI